MTGSQVEWFYIGEDEVSPQVILARRSRIEAPPLCDAGAETKPTMIADRTPPEALNGG